MAAPWLGWLQDTANTANTTTALMLQTTWAEAKRYDQWPSILRAPMRQTSRAAVSLAACLALAACGGQCGSSTSTAGGNQHLVFTGPAAGTLTDATTQCDVFTGAAQLNYLLKGRLSNQDLTFNIHIQGGYTGGGTYPVGSLLDGAGELRLEIGAYQGATTTGAGSLTIGSDERSGSVDADLSGGEHVQGTFRCDEVHKQ
jgi:hypothetical protein